MQRSMGVIRKTLIAFLCLCVALAMLMPSGTVYADDSVVKLYDGVYQGSGEGYASEVVVEVTITNGVIAGVQVLSQDETPGYWKKIKQAFFDQFVGSTDSNVDTVSGATKSCNAIIAGVAEALEQAKSDPNSPFSAGEGTEESPYVIISAAKLAQFADTVDEGETYAGKYVKLGNDIDISGFDKWNPIGEETGHNIFKGTFDGAGKTVSGMNISGKYASNSNLGLFSVLGENAKVKDLTLKNATIKVRNTKELNAGLIAGKAANASVDSSSASGRIEAGTSGAAVVYAGGILGSAESASTITNCWADSDIEAASTGGNESACAGGLAGAADEDSVIANSASFGEINAEAPANGNEGAMAGGLVGELAGKAYNNTASGDVSIVSGNAAAQWVGALAGKVTADGMEADGDGYAYPETGALRAFNSYAKDVLIECVKAGESVTLESEAAGTGNGYDTAFEGTSVDASEMKTAGFADTMDDSIVDTKKLLKAYGYTDISLRQWQKADSKVLPAGDIWSGSEQAEDSVFASGKGTKKNPYIIETSDQLKAFAASVAGKAEEKDDEGNVIAEAVPAETYAGTYIALGDDIDISDEEWSPIGGCSASSPAFNGTFDGSGYEVAGMTIGSEDAAKQTTATNNVNGFFGNLGPKAIVKNLRLTDVYADIESSAGGRLGAIAGLTAAKAGSDYEGTLIINCLVDGVLSISSTRGNAFVGGITGYEQQGAIVNCITDTDITCKNTQAWAEAGGLVGLDSYGLVANCATLGSVETITGADNDGYSLASLLTGCQMGDVVNCYADGDQISSDSSSYAGVLSGWMRGYARLYNCFYNEDSKQTMKGEEKDPKAVVGGWPTAYPDGDGVYYLGGLTDRLDSYKNADKKALAEKLNASFENFPVDVTLYGVEESDLTKWEYDEAEDAVVLTDVASEMTYMRPDCELVPQEDQAMKTGRWYGRDEAGTTVVAVTVSNDKVKGVEIIQGESSGDAYDEAVERAKEKALYGDTSGYGEAETYMFEGAGTKDDPYLVSDEAQLRYIAEAINEDVDWSGVYFKQTKDIKLTQGEWFPIGWGVTAKIKGQATVYSQYPFRGNYDGGDFAITGLTIGTKDAPSKDPRCGLATGLFGLVEGDEQTNDTPQDPETRYCDLMNIHLKDMSVYVDTEYDNYAGAIAGDCELGYHASNCTAEGTVSVKSEKGTVYAGGLMGYVLRGLTSNCWANVDLTAVSGSGAVYAGGMYGTDNRVTTVNSFAAGAVNADSESGNIFAGGLSGGFAGIKDNCYTTSDVTAGKKTDYIGAVNGQLSGIGGESKVYFSEDAKLTAGGEAAEVKANGYSAGAQSQCLEEKLAAAEMSGEALIEKLNAGIDTAFADLTDMHVKVKDINHHGHGMYYSGDGSDLYKWTRNAKGFAAFADSKYTPGDDTAEAVNIKNAKVVLSKTAFTYNAKVQKPVVKTIGGMKLVKGTDYTIKWSNASSKNAGTYTITIKGIGNYKGETRATYKINKAKNTLNAKGKTVSVRYSKLKNKAQTVKCAKAIKVSKAQGKVTYVKKSGNSKITINKKNGAITVKKGLKKGTYKIKVSVKAAGNNNYKALAKNVTFKVKVQ